MIDLHPCQKPVARSRAGYLMIVLMALVLPAFAAHAGVVFTSLHSFIGNDGANPAAGLVQGSAGNLFGTTVNGGTNGYGTVFQMSTNGALATLYNFGSIRNPFSGNADDGANPYAGLILGGDGNLYGTTKLGGIFGLGSVFQITTSGVLTSLVSFVGDYDGAYPMAGLVQDSQGYLYGTTYGGAQPGDSLNWPGTLFKTSTNGSNYSILYTFFGGGAAGGDDAEIEAGLVQGADGALYGTSPRLGGNGLVFSFSTNNLETNLHLFGNLGFYRNYSLDGELPLAGLVQGSDGHFYGTTFGGGTNGYGTVFQISSNGAFASLYSFTGTNDGAGPRAALVQGSDGYLYGTTSFGGSSGNGTVFAVNTNGTGFMTLYSFSASSTNSSGVYTNSDGAHPVAGLILVGNALYGTTQSGGSSGYGTVFSLTLPGPRLTITPHGANVILTWPTNYAGFTLEFATNLVSPAIWNTNLPSPVVVNGQYTVTNPISGTQMFFRLH